MVSQDSMAMETIKQLTLGALDPQSGLSVRFLREHGLHRDVLEHFFEIFRPEIKDLTGWKPLKEFGYAPVVRYPDKQERERGEKLTQVWLELLEKRGLSDERAIQIYDGELLPPPARDYRLFLLRDGRLLYYSGGFYGSSYEPFACGDLLEVSDKLDKRYGHGHSATLTDHGFIVIMSALNERLETAIQHRERKVKEQEAIHARLTHIIRQVSHK